MLRNGNYGMRFKDKTQIFTYQEENQMVSYIPRDVSAQIYFQMGEKFPENIKKHAQIFQKLIK